MGVAPYYFFGDFFATSHRKLVIRQRLKLYETISEKKEKRYFIPAEIYEIEKRNTSI